jgi:CheY-like chemotaxis protein
MTRVLIVDDDPMVCAAIEIYLERQGFDVTIADGGEAGLRALEEAGFDLMLVDIFMPHMRGFESIRIFHERAPTIPLVAMSGYAFANLDSPAPDFLRMALELVACVSRSRLGRCSRPSTKVLPKPGPVSVASSNQASYSPIPRHARGFSKPLETIMRSIERRVGQLTACSHQCLSRLIDGAVSAVGRPAMKPWPASARFCLP